MQSLKEQGRKFVFAGKEYELLFTVNVIDEIQDKFDIDINNLKDLFETGSRKFYSNTAKVLTILINESIEIKNETAEEKEELLKESYVRRHVSNANVFDAFGAIVDAYSLSYMQRDEDSEDEELPNQTSGR